MSTLLIKLIIKKKINGHFETNSHFMVNLFQRYQLTRVYLMDNKLHSFLLSSQRVDSMTVKYNHMEYSYENMYGIMRSSNL